MPYANHLNYADNKGRVFCRQLIQVVNLNDHVTSAFCNKCDMYRGSLQGEGIECFWDDSRVTVEDLGLWYAKDPYVEENSVLAAMGYPSKQSVPGINKSSNHSKITGNFAEHLVLYWLSKYGYECARVDHTGIDLIAKNPKTHELMGISVKSRSRTEGKEEVGLLIESPNFDKAKKACEDFKCTPYFALVVDAGDEINMFLLSMEKMLNIFPLNKGLTWRLSKKYIQQYEQDPEIQMVRFNHQIIRW